MNPTLEKHLISALKTFAATFLSVLGAQLAVTPDLEFATIAGLAVAAVRAGLKLAVEDLLPLLKK